MGSPSRKLADDAIRVDQKIQGQPVDIEALMIKLHASYRRGATQVAKNLR